MFLITLVHHRRLNMSTLTPEGYTKTLTIEAHAHF